MSTEHTSTLDKVKNLFHHSHSEASTTAHSAHAEGFKDSEIRERVHAASDQHALNEERAERNIHDREVESEASTASTLNSEAIIDSGLSSFAPRQSLDALVHHRSAGENPDMTGFRSIPESEPIPKLKSRMEHTAARPSDPNDPNSMDGRPDPSSAGDDLAI